MQSEKSVIRTSGKDWEEKRLDVVFQIKPPKKEAEEKLKANDLVSFVPMRDLKVSVKESILSFPKSITDQKSIVAKLEAIYKQKLADLEELKKSVLKKAFNGEL